MPTRADLLSELDVDCVPNAPVGTLTWYGVGGRADLLVSPRSINAAAELLRRCRLQDVPVRILGGGANLLVDDDGVDGVVVRLDHGCFRNVEFNREGEVTAARVGGGVDLFGLLHTFARQALAGFEHMAGIPGTIGGAVRMNAGGRPGDMAQAIDRVDMLTLDGELKTWSAEDLHFAYRQCSLPPGIVVSAVLRLHEDDPAEVRARVKTFFANKKAAQPMADHSAGCAFRNPMTDSGNRVSAGKLIDDAGLKGAAIGGAAVSTRHANFITVTPAGSAHDVQKLMQHVQQVVADTTGVHLEREVVVWSRGGGA
ncbi:MAG: UDP-N-acetylmuramate dehydrogenase [Phycisphaerales bacterium]|nr:UDP-N-acetylmuramate dehydrogenase [Phycisphaerales bacterium]